MLRGHLKERWNMPVESGTRRRGSCQAPAEPSSSTAHPNPGRARSRPLASPPARSPPSSLAEEPLRPVLSRTPGRAQAVPALPRHHAAHVLRQCQGGCGEPPWDEPQLVSRISIPLWLCYNRTHAELKEPSFSYFCKKKIVTQQRFPQAD